MLVEKGLARRRLDAALRSLPDEQRDVFLLHEEAGTDRPMKQDDSGDPRVSAAYQQMADERTPEHLDHVILNAARGAARPRWNKAIAWLRPAAWVATIGVCLAIVIEISLMPDQQQVEFDRLPQESAPAAAPTADTMRPEKTRTQATEPKKVERLQKPDSSRASDLPARSGDADAAAALESGDSGLKEAEARGRQQPIGDAQLPASLLRTTRTRKTGPVRGRPPGERVARRSVSTAGTALISVLPDVRAGGRC
jgi:hypothetical protein